MKIVFEEMVTGLAKPGAEIVESMTSEKAHLMHMAVGVVGEAGELLDAFITAVQTGNLDIENVTEETGDMEFYLEGLRQGLRIVREDPSEGVEISNASSSIFQLVSAATVKACDLLDSVKKWVIYNKPIDFKVIDEQIFTLDAILLAIYKEVGITRTVAIEANIAKLGKRYAGHNYSDEAAQARADKN